MGTLNEKHEKRRERISLKGIEDKGENDVHDGDFCVEHTVDGVRGSAVV